MAFKNGWDTEEKSIPVTNFSTLRIIDLNFINDVDDAVDLIKKEMIAELAQKIIKNGCAQIIEKNNTANKDKILTAEINVSSPGIKFVGKTDEVFRVNDEKFTEEELIAAVKAHFPERLL